MIGYREIWKFLPKDPKHAEDVLINLLAVYGDTFMYRMIREDKATGAYSCEGSEISLDYLAMTVINDSEAKDIQKYGIRVAQNAFLIA